MQYGHKTIVVVEFLETYEVACCDEDVMSFFDEGVLACLDKNNKDCFLDLFSMNTSGNSFLSKPWVGNVLSAMVIYRKLAGVRPITTSVITITIKLDELP